MVLRCMNPIDYLIEVPSGSVVYIGVGDAGIGQPWMGEELWGTMMCPVDSVDLNVPGHMKELCGQPLVHFTNSLERQQVTHQLFKYADVFRSDERNVGQTELVEHEIPTVQDAQLICWTPYTCRVGPEKEAKQGMIEPAYGV